MARIRVCGVCMEPVNSCACPDEEIASAAEGLDSSGDGDEAA